MSKRTDLANAAAQAKADEATAEHHEQQAGGLAGAGDPDFASLGAEAARVDGESAPPETLPNGDPLPAAIDYAAEAGKMVDTFAALAVGYCPPTASVWDDSKKGSVTAALAPVLEKYGMTMGALPCELVLIVVAGPALYQTAKIVGAQMAADKVKAVQARAAASGQAAPLGTGETARPVGEPGTAPAVAKHPQTALYK